MDTTDLAVKTAKIDVSTATTTAIVAAVTGKKIAVIGYHVIAAGAQTLVWKSGSTALTGTMWLGATLPFNVGYGGSAVLLTAVGEALNLTTGAGQVTGGVVTYVEV